MRLSKTDAAFLAAVRQCGQDAYGVPVRQAMSEALRGRPVLLRGFLYEMFGGVSLGTVYTTADRLEEAGLIGSYRAHVGTEEERAARGHRARCYFYLTRDGERALEEAREGVGLDRGVRRCPEGVGPPAGNAGPDLVVLRRAAVREEAGAMIEMIHKGCGGRIVNAMLLTNPPIYVERCDRCRAELSRTRAAAQRVEIEIPTDTQTDDQAAARAGGRAGAEAAG